MTCSDSGDRNGFDNRCRPEARQYRESSSTCATKTISLDGVTFRRISDEEGEASNALSFKEAFRLRAKQEAESARTKMMAEKEEGSK
jgi:hypothetical protein